MIHVEVKRNDMRTFGELDIGTLFYTSDGFEYIFQKTIPVIDKEYPDDEELNGVMIIGDETGNIIHFENDEKVFPFDNGVLTIE